VEKRVLIALILLGFLLFYISDSDQHETREANVTRVIDGDTVVLGPGERVRLMGIDTTEIGEECSEEATWWLTDKINGSEIEMEVMGEDIYDRTLAYIFKGDLHISKELVEEGLAYTYYFDPDERYIEELVETERRAIEENRGCLWSKTVKDSEDVLHACDTEDHISEVSLVKGVVEEVNYGDGITYLNFEDEYPNNCFTAIVWDSYRDRFPEGKEIYEDRRIVVEGLVTEYQGDPQVEIRDPAQIETLN